MSLNNGGGNVESIDSLHQSLLHIHNVLSHQNIILRDTVNLMEQKFQHLESELEMYTLKIKNGNPRSKANQQLLKLLKQRTETYGNILTNGQETVEKESISHQGTKSLNGQPQENQSSLTEHNRDSGSRVHHVGDSLCKEIQDASNENDLNESIELDLLSDEENMHDESCNATLNESADLTREIEGTPQAQKSMPSAFDDNIMEDIEFSTPPMTNKARNDNTKGSFIPTRTPELVDIEAYTRQHPEWNRKALTQNLNHEFDQAVTVNMLPCTKKEIEHHLPPYIQIPLQTINTCITSINNWMNIQCSNQFDIDDLTRIFPQFDESQLRALTLALLKLNRIVTRTQGLGKVMYMAQTSY